MRRGKILAFLSGLFVTLIWRLAFWMMSLPAWITLILHFTVGLPLFWFWATHAAWLLSGLFWYLTVLFARRCGDAKEEEKENKNPYSVGNDYFKNEK